MLNINKLPPALYRLGLVLVPLLAFIYFANAAFGLSSMGSAKVEFNQPLKPNELIRLVKEDDLKPLEIFYKQGNIQGGYTLKENESIESALKNLLEKHAEFLEIMSAQIADHIDSSKNNDERERFSVLYNELADAQDVFDQGGFTISGILLAEPATNNSSPDNLDLEMENSEAKGLDRQAFAALKAASSEDWAPYGGTSDVTNSYTSQTFYFDDTSGYGSDDTYEHETQVYDVDYADYDGHWCSNMPSAYYDTTFLDDDDADNFAIGSSDAASLVEDVQYFTYMKLKNVTSASATVRIKGQKGHRIPDWCHSTWCIFGDATTGTMALHVAPSGMSWMY